MLYQCPVKDCGHVGMVITKVHYRTYHSIEREVAEKKYGCPKKLKKRGIERSEKKTKTKVIDDCS